MTHYGSGPHRPHHCFILRQRMRTCRTPHNTPMGRFVLKESSESIGEQTKTWHPGNEIAKAWMLKGQNIWIQFACLPSQQNSIQSLSRNESSSGVQSHSHSLEWGCCGLAQQYNLGSYTAGQMGSKPAHIRTPTEISQLIPWYSPQNQPGQSHFRNDSWLTDF